MRFSIITLGCKVNAYESEYYAEALEKLGHVRDDEDFDVCIINTCTVTNTAAAKSRKMIHRAKKAGARVVVVGCFAQTADEDMKEKLGADLIIGAMHKKDLPEKVDELLKTPVHETEDLTRFEEDFSFESMPIHTFEGRNRAFLKVQDGCDQFCTYCAIPFARGRERSLNAQDAVNMVCELEKSGHKEVVLTGIHTGRYHDGDVDLAKLLKLMLEKTEDVSFRISSIEITEVGDDLLELMAADKRILPHLHIPIQSGSDTVLERMGRPYTVEQFKARIDEIRSRIPRISISTDVMCGFVGETDAEFDEMMKNLEEIGFSFLHVFPYSERKGTKASRMGPAVHGSISRTRTEKLLELSERLRRQDMARFDEGTVLVEQKKGDVYSGYTEQYHPVQIHADHELSGRITGKLVVCGDHYEMEEIGDATV